MKTRKTTQTAAPKGDSVDQTTTIDAAAVVVSVDADVTAAQNGLAAVTNNPPAVDMESEKTRYTAALESLNIEETSVSGSRIREIPAVQTIDAVMKTVGAIYYRKTAAQTVKDTAAEYFPVLRDANGSTDAALQSIMHCGMSRATAKNMLYLARRDDLVKLVQSGDLSVSVAYRLATDSELDETAAAAAAQTNPRLTPVTVARWQVARVACQKIKPAWAAYDGARAESQKLTVGKARTAAAQRATLAWETVQELWDVIHAARPATLREYDPVLCDVLTGEMAARETAAQTAAAAAAQTAQTATATAADMTAAVETAAAAVQTAAEERAAAVLRAKTAADLTNQLKKDLETAQDAAAAEIRERLKTAAADAAAAAADMTAAQTEEANAKTALAKAESAAQRATLTAAAATATATKTAAAATAPKSTRPTGANMPELVKAYKALTSDALRVELENVTAAVSKGKKLPQWLAVGRALELDLFE